MTQIDRNWVMKRLLELPYEVEEAEHGVIVASLDVEEAKRELAEKVADLYNEGKVEGKSEAQRKACLLSLTADERAAVAANEESLANCRRDYNRKLNDFSAIKAIARLLAGEDEEA